ncbi:MULTISPECIES: hypothetical protein [Hyphobacterium]|uniref:Uncharacterized protein n=1 Tax=Hyphobacterium vulgare TaxID=1736751 RepID=A0ABV6ZVX6_9PROT
MLKMTMMVAAAVLFGGSALAQDGDWRAAAAARLPDTGEMNLQMLNAGEVDGYMRLGWRRNDGRIEMFDRSMMMSADIFESMTAAMTDGDFAPLETVILWHQESAVMTLDTVASDGRVTGTQTILRPLSGEQSAPIELDLPDGVMPRAATFVLAPFMGLEPGESVSYDWYAVLANSVATVTVTAFEGGVVDTPAGRYEDTLRLEVRGTQPENDIFVANGEVVRIDVVGRDMTFLRRPDPQPVAQ